MGEKRWHVVPGAEDRVDPTVPYWTVSLRPDEPGWETDSGYPGYGLTKALAEELAYGANLAWELCEDAKRGIGPWAIKV